MFHRLRYATYAAVALGFVLAPSGSAFAAENWNLYNHQSAPQFTTSVGAKTLADRITKETNGEVKVRLHLAGTLQIPTSNITSAVAQNIVQMGDDQYFSGNVPLGGVLKLPFLIQSPEEFEKASEILRPHLEKAFADKGVVMLAGYTYPLQYIWGRKSFDSLASLKDAKLRVATPEQGDFIREFGGSSVTIGASEVPSALDRGVVDGIVTGSVGAELWKDMLSSGYLIGLNYNNVYFIVNADAFKSLSPENQAVIKKAAEEVAAWNTKTMQVEDAQLLQSLKPRLKMTEPTAEELAKATEAMKPLWDKWAADRDQTTRDVLAEIRAALGK